MYSQFAAGVVVQMLMLTAAQATSMKFTASDALAGVAVDRSGTVSRVELPAPPPLADPRVASASGSFVAQPPVDPATISSNTAYTSYPPYSPVPYPYPYPYPYPQLAYSTAAPTTSYDDTSRLFGNIGHALNPANLFSCPAGNVGCIISKIAAAVFVLAGLGLAVYLVYALVTGKLGSFDLGR